MQLIRLLRPKGIFTWIAFLLLTLAVVVEVGPRLRNPAGMVAGGAVLTGAVLLFWKLPSRWQEFWMDRGHFLRCVVHGLILYVVIVSLGCVSEMHNLRNWWEMVTLTGGAPTAYIHGLGMMAVGLAVVIDVNTVVTRPIPLREMLIRGPSLISHADADRIARAHLNSREPSLRWGGVELPMRCGTEHFCVIGESGSGKTKTIQLLLKSILPTVRPGSNRRAILYDAKRDLFSTLASFNLPCRVQTMHPFDERGVAWDIAADVTDPMIAIEIATILIPEKAGEKDPYFPQAARALLSGVFESLLRNAPGKWTLRDAVLALRYPARTRVLLKSSTDTRYLIEKYAGNTRSARDIASTLENSMRRLSFVAAAWERATEKISLEDWLKNGESVLLLGSSPKMESTFRELNRAILHRAAQLIREQGEAEREGRGRPPRQTWIVVDELREAGRMEGLNSLLVEGRSKGACVVLGLQDIPGLHSVYGRELAAELIGLCSNKAFLRSSDNDTQQFASHCFGTQEIDLPRTAVTHGVSKTYSKENSVSETYSTQVSYQRQTKPLVLPSQFRSDLPRPHPTTGLSGYYLTALVGQPYFANIPGNYIHQALGQVDYNTLPEEHSDFLPRIDRDGKLLSLLEWDDEDLKRLNLREHPELLETDEATEDKERDPQLPERGDWAHVLPEE